MLGSRAFTRIFWWNTHENSSNYSEVVTFYGRIFHQNREREKTYNDYVVHQVQSFASVLLQTEVGKTLKWIRKSINYSWHTTTGYFILSYIRRTMKIWLVESIHQHTLACEIEMVQHVEFKVYRVFQRRSRTREIKKDEIKKKTPLWCCQIVRNWRDLLKKTSKRPSTLVTQLKRLWNYLPVKKP